MAIADINEKLTEHEQAVRGSSDETISTTVFDGIQVMRTKIDKVSEEVQQATADLGFTNMTCDALAAQSQALANTVNAIAGAPMAVMNAVQGFMDSLKDKITGEIVQLAVNELAALKDKFAVAVEALDAIDAVCDQIDALSGLAAAEVSGWADSMKGVLGDISLIRTKCACINIGPVAALDSLYSAIQEGSEHLDTIADALSASFKTALVSQLQSMFDSTIAGQLDSAISKIDSLLSIDMNLSLDLSLNRLNCLTECMQSICTTSDSARKKAATAISTLDLMASKGSSSALSDMADALEASYPEFKPAQLLAQLRERTRHA